MRKYHFVLLLSLLLTSFLQAGAQQYPSTPLPLGTKEAIVFRKNYPFLYYCYTTPTVRKLLLKDTVLRSISNQYHNQLKAVINNKPAAADTFAVMNALEFQQADVQLVHTRLTQLETLYPQVFQPLTQWLRKSGCYDAQEDGNTIITTAWQQDARGINYTIGVYGKGKKPNYPHIDSISFNVYDRSYPHFQQITGQQIYKETDSAGLFFSQPLLTALRLLEINGRYHSADYEPMEKTVNAAAIARVKTISWKKYAYTHINILGAGPDNMDDSLNPAGILRCRIGAMQYFMGRAPFIVVSGGRVHPYKTNYSEAEEMKQYLVNELGVPAHAVIMEPHARHTTTNIRNTARLLIHYGIPLDKPGIVCSTADQMGSVMSEKFARRCLNELGFVPYHLGKKLSETEAEYYVLPVSLRLNVTEPLDP